MKVMSVVGARPQFIKSFAVSRVLRDVHNEILVHTGQHYDKEMSEIFFEELGMPEPDYNLEVGSSDHATQTAEMITGIDSVILEENPDTILLYGDTNSTLAGAIAGSKRDAYVAHIEAGLRSHNRTMPEEINRRLTDHASDQLFAPSKSAVNNLEREGLTDGVHLSGDVMYDAILWARDVADDIATVHSELELETSEYILATVHRPSNTDDEARLRRIIEGLVSAKLPVVFPVHPRTKKYLQEYEIWEQAGKDLRLINPVGYFDFVQLLDGAERVITDSGGVQKEAFFLDTYCVTLREETEWVETVEAGWNELVSVDDSPIEPILERDVSLPETKPSPYGDGEAAEYITNKIK